MDKKPQHPVLPSHVFIKRLTRHILIGMSIIFCSLGIGMWGYHSIENMAWIDAYENAAMILAGMGPVTELKTHAGKLFAGTYALFSGIIFLVIIAVIFAPVVHRFLHKFNIDEKE